MAMGPSTSFWNKPRVSSFCSHSISLRASGWRWNTACSRRLVADVIRPSCICSRCTSRFASATSRSTRILMASAVRCWG